MECNHEALRMLDLRNLVKDRGLWDYSSMRKAELINLLRFQDDITRMLQKQFDLEELDNEEDHPFYDPMIATKKQFDPEESVKEEDSDFEELYPEPPSDECPMIMEQKQFNPEESDNKE